MYSCVHAQMPEEGVWYPYSLEIGSLNTAEATLAVILPLPAAEWASFSAGARDLTLLLILAQENALAW